ncbi:unnamed protein product [Calicophoron daubneyi]|uniref:Calpain catalytic domain-containing protein n=1 Tax=Calicophoron daubneyi TaxID=300641 RepID=A0AAV2TV09_CALDB
MDTNQTGLSSPQEIQASEVKSNDGLARPGAPDEYLNILKPKRGTGRLEFHPDIPKTLTPKGYEKIKSKMESAKEPYEKMIAQAKKDQRLWEDPDFPASDASIGDPKLEQKVEWKRPKEINPEAQVFVGGFSRLDIEQGALGDCWLLASISSIANYPALFDHVIPKDQNMQDPTYAGVFRARFWRFGQWIEVTVDDRLPVYKGTNDLVFVHSPDSREYWASLLEKAYAKLHGCYAKLDAGLQSEAMEDLTGGVAAIILLQKDERPNDLLQRMLTYVNRCCLMGCAVITAGMEQRLDNGLIGRHAYSVTSVQPVDCSDQRRHLIRCRNPWGGPFEWKGAWSDKSSDWNKVSKEQKTALDLQFHDDGEFWMSFEDFTSSFTFLEVCHLGLESLEYDQDFHGRRRLEESVFAGSWEKGVNAGGGPQNKDTFWTNPQFAFKITDPDPNDDENKCLVIIALMQKGIRAKQGCEFLPIGFTLYQANGDQTDPLTREQLSDRPVISQVYGFITREVTEHIRLTPGTYVVIPSTYDKDEEAQFIVRIFAQVAIADRELDQENRMEEPHHPEELRGSRDQTAAFEEIEQKFKLLADPSTGTIGLTKLTQLLNDVSAAYKLEFAGYDKELCRSLLASVDLNMTGQLNLSELKDLWMNIRDFRTAFVKHLTADKATIDAVEFREALKDAGFTVSNKVFSALVHRYEDLRTETMDFDDFLLCAIRLKIAFETADAQANISDGSIMLTKEDYLRVGIYV